MSIERDARIEFHEAGTLISVTRWIRSHDEGIAEWLGSPDLLISREEQSINAGNHPRAGADHIEDIHKTGTNIRCARFFRIAASRPRQSLHKLRGGR